MRRTKKPASPEQLAANRANAGQSSGPKTPEGKARSAQNSLKHGFTASTFAVVRLEDLQEIARAQNRNYCLAEGFLRLARQSNGWSIFLRYQAQAERQYRRALEDFDRLKALRPDLPNEDLPNEPISGFQAQ